MRPSTRLFELIQILRGATGPITAAALAASLEVAARTVHRDIAALQRMPIEGAAGIGYLLRPGYDLPPLAFTQDERDALSVALRLLGRLGDAGLVRAGRARRRQARQRRSHSRPGRRPAGIRLDPPAVDLAMVRGAIRAERALSIAYLDTQATGTTRTVLPLALIYYVDVIAGWCRLRQAFRHFRADRISALERHPVTSHPAPRAGRGGGRPCYPCPHRFARRLFRSVHATYSSKRPLASRSRSYRRLSGNGGSQASRRTIQLS